jgi:hypothetical protein
MRSTVETAARIGELLVAQKKECGHGNWELWIKANLSLSQMTISRYIRCYKNLDKINLTGTVDLSIEQAAQLFCDQKWKTRIRFRPNSLPGIAYNTNQRAGADRAMEVG